MLNLQYARMAENTKNIFQNGSYLCKGKMISVQSTMHSCIQDTRMYFQEQEDFVSHAEQKKKTMRNHHASISFSQQSTMSAAEMLAYISSSICVLNFANATIPGNEYLKGANHQESSIARISGLTESQYHCWNSFYVPHTETKDPYYSHRIIYSPKVPVIKDEDGKLLENPYCINVISAAPVDVEQAKQQQCFHSKKVYHTMYQRIKQILCVAALNNNDVLILGAFGCGSSENEVFDVADIFGRILIKENFQSMFSTILFAIQDKSSVFNMFQEHFQQMP